MKAVAKSIPHSLFENSQVSQSFICSICLEVPMPQYAIEHVDCGKMYCEKCINDWFTTSSICPFCKKEMKTKSRSIAKENKNIYQLMQSSRIKCTSSKECKWVGELGSLNTHLNSCEESTITCKCGKPIKKKEVIAHQQNCNCAILPCKYCKISFLKKELKDHENACTKGPSAKINCGYSDIGCKFIGNQEELEMHLEASFKYHLNLHQTAMSKYANTQDSYIDTKESKISPFFEFCPKNHKLTEKDSFSQTNSCNVCGKHIEPMEHDWRCDICDFDCCESCHFISDKPLTCPFNSKHLFAFSFLGDGNCIACNRVLVKNDRVLFCPYCKIRKCIDCHYDNLK